MKTGEYFLRLFQEETFPMAIKWHRSALCLSGKRHARKDVLRASVATLKVDPPAGK